MSNPFQLSSPSKRRRTKGSNPLAMSAIGTNGKSPAWKTLGLLGTSGKEKENILQLEWPADGLPVELFTLIVSYLPRSGVQNMRLVNKEFDRKVSEALFRTVVVPFRPEIYDITPETTGSNDIAHGSIMLQDQGMQVFQGFGRWIKRFAMSFEIDHTKLASPPRKSDQEVILSFWGLYRWPFKQYNRYSQLEGLEQTADETRTMAKALKYISSAKELGLSIDGGLGWLAGADINQRVAERGDMPIVFGASKFVPELRSILPKVAPKSISQVLAVDPSSSSEYHRYLMMVLEAGIPERDADAAVKMLQADDHAGTSSLDKGSSEAQQATTILTHIRTGPRRRLVTNNSAVLNAVNLTDDSTELSDGEEIESLAADVLTTQLYINPGRKASKNRAETNSLKPNDLTNAQREMLLEMEWAQNAFMQSWAIAIMDNHSTFSGIEKLNIARLPSRHIAILRREDFWDSLPSLKCLALAIIPDWREVKKEATSWVQDSRIAPSQSVSVVYDLLTQQIGRREHIKELHFEWLCGGEYAPGLFARNQNILAAPVVSTAMNMVDRSQQQSVLDLPHIEHLSLKNCWFSPHILYRFLHPMRKGVLQSISFDSVSLTAGVPQNARPNPVTQAALAQNAANHAGQWAANNFLINLQQNVVAGAGAQIPIPNPQLVVPDPNAEPTWLERPRVGSWADIINFLTPSTTLEDIRHTRGFGPDPEDKEATKLTKLSFKSCGYARVALDFDQSLLEVGLILPIQSATVTKRISDIDGYMMKPLETCTLATIVNNIDAVEVQTLGNAWGMSVGWRLTRPELAADAQLDGFQIAGNGRFDGLIEVTQGPTSRRFS
ncbi:hypothetical protein VTL71DRAFT_8183 [Oculimacula yallundae]|uniref:F-box domain-containing protein n=1 Tax=Oculimacula yallundae TaxID=86028 RepID=A0ABR4CWZ4_9HELO